MADKDKSSTNDDDDLRQQPLRVPLPGQDAGNPDDRVTIRLPEAGGGSDAADEIDARALVRELPGFPPCLEVLVSQISEGRASGAPKRAVGSDATGSKKTLSGSPSSNTSVDGRRSIAAYRKALYETMGEFTPLTKLPREQDETNVVPHLRAYDLLAYWRALFCPKDQSVVETFRRAVYKPIAGFIWFICLIWWEVLLGIVVSAFAYFFVHRNEKVTWDSDTNGYLDEYKNAHRNFGAILGFVIGFRVNMAYQSYTECRRTISGMIASIREIVLEVYTASSPKGFAGPKYARTGEVVPCGSAAKVDAQILEAEASYLKETATEVRRLCMLLLAFIRQDVREKRFGFLRGTEMEVMPFMPGKNFFLDPVRPRLWDLLTEGELLDYSKIHPRSRPGVVAGHIKGHLEGMGYRSEKGLGVVYRVSVPLIQSVLLGHETLVRLRDTPLPYPFNYVLRISTFVFVYSTPFFYQTDQAGVFLCIQFLILIYYGLLYIAAEIEFPCRYTHGGFSVPLEKFCHRIHSDCLQYAKALGGDSKSFIPAYLERVEK